MRLIWFGLLFFVGAAGPVIAADCIDPWRSNDPMSQLWAQRLPSTVFDRSPTSGAFGQALFGSFGGVDFAAVLESPCSQKVNLSGLNQQNYYAAVGSGAFLNLFLEFAREREARQLVNTDGVDKQIVEPRAAKSSFGWLPDAEKWRNRVAAEEPEIDQGKSACQLAIDELKAVACKDKSDTRCDIEKSYREVCLGTNDKATQGSCVAAVDAYLGQCFGGGTPPGDLGNAVSLCRVPNGGGDFEDYCSSSIAVTTIRGDYSPLLLTARHCLLSEMESTTPPVSFDLDQRCGFDGLSTRLSSYGQSSGDIAVIATSKDSVLFRGPDTVSALPIARPVLFARTYLGGFNSLAQSRNEVADKYNRNNQSPPKNLPSSFPIRSTLRWDASALCTIVKIEGDQITHTCQSASGTSGGALVQVDDNDDGTMPRLVGIHLGAPEKTSGAYNYGFALDPNTEINPRY